MVYRVKHLVFDDLKGGNVDLPGWRIIHVLNAHSARPGSQDKWYIDVLVEAT